MTSDRVAQPAMDGEVDFCSCRSTDDWHSFGCIMERRLRRSRAAFRKSGPAQAFLAEIVGYATAEGIRAVTRAELYALCIARGETPAEADASAFGPWTRPLRGDEPGLILDGPRALEIKGEAA